MDEVNAPGCRNAEYMYLSVAVEDEDSMRRSVGEEDRWLPGVR